MADRIEITTEKMLQFFRNFDVIEHKYQLKEKELSAEAYYDRYNELSREEDYYQFSELTRIDYGDALSNLELIYGGVQQSEEIVELFDLVRKKIIFEYLNIDGLERLFSEKYIDFEWDMHLGIDYKDHKMKFYRDHFVHQIRNAFCMHKMLEQLEWDEKIGSVLLNSGNSKISSFVCKCIGQQMLEGNFIGKDYKEYNCEKFYCRNLIYMSSYMAALFHDIGYPEVTNAQNQKRIVEYIANLYNTESSGYNYSRLHALLQNSLLFRVVPFDEIRDRLAGNKTDHGALSAVIFLLDFYENGAIHGLMPIKKCAVELAALAIYNHTNKYRYNNNIRVGEYVRISFTDNPISYLLRICDDLQEWGRIYFELSRRSNLIICSKCKTPIVRTKNESGKWYYRCNCNQDGKGDTIENSVFEPLFDYDTNFFYRRIYNVTVCEKLLIEAIDDDMLKFSLKYDLQRLLHIAYINPQYAKFRIMELNNFKKLLDNQRGLPVMKLDYFITANPVLIKVEFINRCFFKRYKDHEEWKNLIDNLGVTNEESWNSAFEIVKDNVCDMINRDFTDKIYDDVSDTILQSVRKAVCLYVELVIYMWLFTYQNSVVGKKSDFLENRKISFLKKKADRIESNLCCLLEDCFIQFERMYSDWTAMKSNPKEYYMQYQSDEYLYGCVCRYLAVDRYLPVCAGRDSGNGPDYVDAYTDLALFRGLAEFYADALNDDSTEENSVTGR